MAQMTQRVEMLEKQLAALMQSQPTLKTDKKSKNADKPKTKRVSGYLLFSEANRADVKAKLTADAGEEKPKNSDVMVELGKLWKALSEEEQAVWNDKAKAVKDSDASSDSDLEAPPKAKKEKKPKKEVDPNKPKTKRVSGYLLFSAAMRDEVKEELFGDEKPKNSEIMVELGKRWKALTEEEQGVWNEKAAQSKNEGAETD